MTDVIYGKWGFAFMAKFLNPDCAAGDGPILPGQWAKCFTSDDGIKEIFHDDCAEENGAYD